MFEVFRKYQKTMLASLAILAMFAFILSGAIDSLSQSQQGGDPVVSTAWNRKIKLSEVREVQFQREKINELLRRAAAHAKLTRMPGGFPTDPDNTIAGIALAMRAEKLGITISDQEIMDWLNRQTEEKLTAADFRGLISGAINPFKDSSNGQSGMISEFALFAALGRELAAQRLLTVSLPPPATVLDAPIEVWNQESPKLTQVALEFTEIPVAKFIDTAAQPTQQQLEDTYNQFATVEANPAEKKVGFLMPRRVTLQYLEAKIDAIAAAEPVSDEEIAKYYEENKEDFIEVPKPTLDTSTPTTPAPPTESTPAPAPESKPAETPATPPAESPTPPAEQPTAPSQPESPPAPSPPAEGKLSSRWNWPTLSGTLARWMVSPLTGYQEPAAPADPPKTEPAPTPPSTEQAKEEPAPATENPSPPASEPTPAPEAPAPVAPPAPRQKSLDEVKEEIRKIIQKQKAEKTLKAKMQGIIDSTLAPYLTETYMPARREYQDAHTKDGVVDMSGFTPPALPDMQKLAESVGAELKTAGPVGVAELDSLGPLGTAVRVDRRAGTGVPESLRRLAYGPNPGEDLYAARMLYDPSSGTCFLYWKTKDENPKPQPLDEVKDKVAELWRESSARPKAKELAQQIIDKAKGNEGKLEAGLGADSGLKVQTTDTFPRVRMIASGVTPGLEQPIQVKIANIPGAGEAFLDEVFKLKQGEFAILSDEKQENVYVVKMANRIEPDFAAFASRYRSDNVIRRQYAQFLGRDSQALVMRQILEEAKIDPPLFQPRQREIESSDVPAGTEG